MGSDQRAELQWNGANEQNRDEVTGLNSWEQEEQSNILIVFQLLSLHFTQDFLYFPSAGLVYSNYTQWSESETCGMHLSHTAQSDPPLEGKVRHFGKYIYLFIFYWELDKNNDTTLKSKYEATASSWLA